MTKIRTVTKRYKLSKNRFMELYYFCLQYPDWKKQGENEEGVRLIEQTAMETDEELYPWILEGVTQDVNCTYLINTKGMPCSRNTWYDRRRKFYYLLSKNKD